MLTRRMRYWLRTKYRGVKTPNHPVYKSRIQKKIDQTLEDLFEIAKDFPEIFLDSETEFRSETGKVLSQRRIRKLLCILKTLNPNIEMDLVLKNIEPPETIFEQEAKNLNTPQPSTNEPCQKTNLSAQNAEAE